jgi:hypothetical protein
MLDRSLALRFKSRSGLPRVRISSNLRLRAERGLLCSRFVFSLRRVYERFEHLAIFMLDRSLALRFKSRRGLPYAGTARLSYTVGARAEAITLALCFFPLTVVYERFEHFANFSRS